MFPNVRTHPRHLTCSALTALAVCLALLSPAGALAAPPPFAQTGPATAVTDTTATVTGTVDPAGRQTTYVFAYGPTTRYGATTPPQDLPAGPPVAVTATLTGLTPGTLYHYRLFAVHPGRFGEAAAGADATFTTAPAPAAAPAPPVAPSPVAAAASPAPAIAAPVAALGSTVVVAPVSGTVRVKAPGTAAFTTLAAGAAVPVGAVLDTRSGTVALTSALTGGRTQTATFHSGIFEVRQSAKSGGMTDIFLRGPAVSCGRSRSTARAAAVAKRKRPQRQLWGRDNGGRFRTHGKNSVATVRGTSWVTTDTCSGTRTTVRSGAVSVRDVHRHRTVLVRAGHSYLARRR
jgi:hypothetical protein